MSTLCHYIQQLVPMQLTEFALPNQFATSSAGGIYVYIRRKGPNELVSNRYQPEVDELNTVARSRWLQQEVS